MDGEGLCYSVASGRLPYRPLTMSNQLRFLYHCLLFSANCGEESITTDIIQPLDKNYVIKLTEYLIILCGDEEEKIIDKYLSFIKYALNPGAGNCLQYMYM